MNKKGFTLIELVLVIVILGILAMYALPRYMNLSQEHALAERDAVLGAVRAGIAYHKAESRSRLGGSGKYPLDLDEEKNGPCKKCFNGILFQSVNDPRWRKTDKDSYQFNDGDRVYNYVYSPDFGTLEWQ